MKIDHIDPIKDYQIKIQKEENERLKKQAELKKAYLAKPYKRSPNAAPFKWD